MLHARISCTKQIGKDHVGENIEPVQPSALMNGT